MSKTLTITLALLAAVTIGCGKKTTFKTRDGEVTVDRNGGQVTYEGKSKDGTVKIAANEGGVALPDNFPKDMPIYKGAVVKVSSTQDKTMLAHMTVPASQADVLKYYQDQLKDQGWEIEATMNMGEGSMITANKSGRQGSVMIIKQDKETMVQLTVTQEGS
ncbi:MAG: hypothetical protein WCJ35_28975, partial [Planctomycetota bacterium]